ncbi:MAG TPA: hypothetical protein VNL13_02530 [Sulfolobales archaeon]|nr:hypothetical protein [Sulfolobales archaeon]
MISTSGLYRLILLVILITTIPTAIGMWSDKAMISAKVKTGEARIYITSYKALAFKEQKGKGCISSDGEVTFSNNNRSMSVIFTNISQGWYGWVGLVISNEGVFPRTIGRPSVIAPINISISRFLYGPFRAPGTSGIWGDVNICVMTSNLASSGNPFPGNVDTGSIYLQPSYKAIAWVFLNYTGVENLSSISITIGVAG